MQAVRSFLLHDILFSPHLLHPLVIVALIVFSRRSFVRFLVIFVPDLSRANRNRAAPRGDEHTFLARNSSEPHSVWSLELSPQQRKRPVFVCQLCVNGAERICTANTESLSVCGTGQYRIALHCIRVPDPHF